MNALTRFAREIARRNLIQTLGIFLGAGWGLLQVVDLFTERGFLPSWTFDGALLANCGDSSPAGPTPTYASRASQRRSLLG